MRNRALLCVLCLIGSAITQAAELTPLINGDWIGMRLQGLSLPASLDKDLKSGLTNRILIRATLMADSQVLGRKSVEVDVTYDLWDENFRLAVNVEHDVVHSEVIATIGAAIAAVKSPTLPDLFLVSDSNPETKYVLKGEILLNPIEREKLDKLRKWVAENNSSATTTGPVLPDLTGVPAPLPGTAPSDSLFNRIFEQYARGDDIAASWQMTLVSKAFTVPVPRQ